MYGLGSMSKADLMNKADALEVKVRGLMADMRYYPVFVVLEEISGTANTYKQGLMSGKLAATPNAQIGLENAESRLNGLIATYQNAAPAPVPTVETQDSLGPNAAEILARRTIYAPVITPSDRPGQVTPGQVQSSQWVKYAVLAVAVALVGFLVLTHKKEGA